MVEKVTFSSDALPANLGERARFELWHDIHTAEIASLDYAISGTRPFAARLDAMALGRIALGEMSGTINRAERAMSNIKADGGQGHCLFINTGQSLMGGTQVGREFVAPPGAAVLISNSEPVTMFGGDINVWMSVVMPEATLGSAFSGVNDRLAIEIGAGNEALRLLQRYSQFLEAGATLASADLVAHAADTVIDLVGLAAGMKGQQAALGDLRGVRAARLSAIIEHIGRHFADPRLSALTAAADLGLSARYIQDILQETGIGFVDRVLELRLQRARMLLADRRNDGKRIGDIALASGFGDIPHFNRCFRRRFGCTPGAAR